MTPRPDEQPYRSPAHAWYWSASPSRAILRIAIRGDEMTTRVQKWGNSQGVRLSREVLAEAGIEVGALVDVSVRDGAVLLMPARRVRGCVSLEDLVAQIPEGAQATELEWGPPAGGEVW